MGTKYRVVFAKDTFIAVSLVASKQADGLFDGHPFVDCDQIDMSGPLFAFSFPAKESRPNAEGRTVALQCHFQWVLVVNEYNPGKKMPLGFAPPE